jgi:hypothetical protein
VCLQAQLPLGMGHAVLERKLGIRLACWSVHGLQKEVLEHKRTVPVRFGTFLRVDEFEFVTGVHDQLGTCFRTDADPVHALRNLKGPICLDGNFELVVMQGVNECLIQLQEWFASCTDHKTVAAGLLWPFFRDGISHRVCVREFVPALSVNTNEIGVAELADCAGSILLSSRPEITASEPTKHGGPACLRALALERVEDLLHRVAHAVNRPGSFIPSGSDNPFSSNPFIRSTHESHSPQGDPVDEGS